MGYSMRDVNFHPNSINGVCVRNDSKYFYKIISDKDALKEANGINGAQLYYVCNEIIDRFQINNGYYILVTKIDKKIIQIIMENPITTQHQIALNINKSKRTVQTRVKKLRDLDIIVREGSQKSGQWRVKIDRTK